MIADCFSLLLDVLQIIKIPGVEFLYNHNGIIPRDMGVGRTPSTFNLIAAV